MMLLFGEKNSRFRPGDLIEQLMREIAKIPIEHRLAASLEASWGLFSSGGLGALFARIDNCSAEVLFETTTGRFF